MSISEEEKKVLREMSLHWKSEEKLLCTAFDQKNKKEALGSSTNY
jgi:hypothetical protein